MDQRPGRTVTALDAAHANDFFETFLNANTLKTILGTYRNICELLHLKPNAFPHFYPKLKSHLTSWRAKALWKKFDARANNKCYGKGKLCPNTRVLIIGAGPCGLRSAIEAQLLGAKVVVVEKRDRISRNNVLHLWPFVIDDLRLLGAKKFFGKFCAGAIDHISIRQLQCILLKVALLLGVEIHTEVSFERLIEPDPVEKTGWKAVFKPSVHPVHQFEFDVVIGADGRRNTLEGFKRKEFRGKLAIAITANFINKRTEAEARVEEISGVAFIFNQKFFKDLFAETGIDLENIVYYKDDTHYFVMTAKKHSLIDKGVIKKDLPDTAKLLANENVDRQALMRYAREAAEFSTEYKMLDLEFAVDYYGRSDVAMFDFTSMYQAENASRIMERHGYKLLSILVGDSLLEPFWPTGSGCARGFLSSLDAGWAIRGYGSHSATPLEVLAERESIYRLLPQTTPENLNRDYKSYTLDPATRYPNLNRNLYLPQQVIGLYDTDDVQSIELNRISFTSNAEKPNKRRRLDSQMDPDTLLSWIKDQVQEHEDLVVTDFTSLRDGRVLCAIISHYRPDLLDFHSVSLENALDNNDLAFELLEKEIGIPAVLSPQQMIQAEQQPIVAYLTQIYDAFRREIPHIKHPKLRSITATTRYNALRPHAVPSLMRIPKPPEKSKFSIVQRSTHPPDLSLMQANPPADELSQSSDESSSSASTVVLMRKQSDTDLSSERIEVENVEITMRSATLRTESKRLQMRIDRMNRTAGSNAQTKEGTSMMYVENQIQVRTNREAFERINNCLYIVLPGYIESLTAEILRRQANTRHVRTLHPSTAAKFLSVSMQHPSTQRNRGNQADNNGYDRIVRWLSASNFQAPSSGCTTPASSAATMGGLSDLTSVTRQGERPPVILSATKRQPIAAPSQKDMLEALRFEPSSSVESIQSEHSSRGIRKFVDGAAKCMGHKITQTRPAQSTDPDEKCTCPPMELIPTFHMILSNNYDVLEIKRYQDTSTAFTKNHPVLMQTTAPTTAFSNTNVSTRPSSNRHRRHGEGHQVAQLAVVPTYDRKPRKRRSAMEKVAIASVEERMKRLEEIATNRSDRHNKRRQQRKMQTEQFIKSMQMLHANSIAGSDEPFEDYSIFLYRQTAPNFEDRVKDLEKKFTYVPDRENRPPIVQQRGEKDEEFQARIKGMEDKWQESCVAEKKPKDLLRAIGKIDNTDWNIKQIEKKIIENKLGKNVSKDQEKVPKWSREQFQARQLKMEKQHLERQDSAGEKYAEIDKNIKMLDQRLKEGTVREQSRQKVAQITEKLKPRAADPKPPPKTTANKPAIVLPTQGKSETCHFCDKRVYLMERLTAEEKHFHRGCFRCQYCHTALRLGSYMYDRDGKYGYRFYCSQHFGMPGELRQSAKVVRKPSQTAVDKSPEKKLLSGVAGVDLLDRVQTPERIEFDLSAGHASSDHEEPLSQMDEDEWTDRNFGASAAEVGSSDDEDSSLSDSEDDDDDAFEEALEEPPTKEGTLKLFTTLYKKRFSKKHHNDSDSDSYSSSDRSSYYENSSGDDDSDTATEGEEEIQARERRKMEVQVKPPIVHTDTGTDTEIPSDDDTSSSSEIQNSATEISTDSEFAQDDPTPTCEIPSIVFNDMFVTKTRGSTRRSTSPPPNPFRAAATAADKKPAPQKVQVRSTEIQRNTASTTASPATATAKTGPGLAPLVPPVRVPFAPLLLRTEGYALNRTQSTGGIATKVSLELKKKYLLGESNASNAIQKSGSASTLDSKFKSFHSNISDCQKLLKPSAEASASMQTFCNKLDEQRTSPISPSGGSRNFKEKNEIIEEKPEVVVPMVPNETEGRPRSPVHETSIIVPQIDWSSQQKEKVISSGSTESTTSSTDSDENNALQKSPSVKAFQLSAPNGKENNNENIPPDSLNYINYTKIESQPSSINEPPKSIASEKKSLNQPKTLPKFDAGILLHQVHTVLHKPKPEENTERVISGRSTPSHESALDPITAALTETELSDWARDGLVSDDFEESDYEMRDHKYKSLTSSKPIEAENLHVKTVVEKPPQEETEEKFECISNILCPTLDNIEFMDTGSESSEEEEVAKNNGYIQFHDEEEIAEDSLSPVTATVKVVEAKSPIIKATFEEDFDTLSTISKNTGYCIIEGKPPRSPRSPRYGGEVTDLKPTDLEKLKEKQNLFENEEDSLIIVEKSTTDDNTCSDSTVKNVMDMAPKEPPPPPPTENNNTLDKKRLEDKLAQVKKDMKKLSEQRKAAHIEEQNLRNNIEFEQHCQRLQSKVDFGNAKDSIDIRKARRLSKSGSPPKPDLIQEEKEVTSPIRSRKEQIELERDVNKRLVQEMVMNKMRAENKSLERKRRNRNFSPNLSPSRPYGVVKSPTSADFMRQTTPDVLLSTINQNSSLHKSETIGEFHTPGQRTNKYASRPLSAFIAHAKPTSAAEAFSLPDIQKAVNEDFTTPKAPPRANRGTVDGSRTVEKLKEDARARARLLSDEDLGLSPEEKLAQLRLRLARRGIDTNTNEVQTIAINAERPTSLFYKNDTLSKKKNSSFRRSKSGDDHLNVSPQQQLPPRERTKSFGEMHAKLALQTVDNKENRKCFKSDPNLLLDSVENKSKEKKEKKPKDRERRKSITKMFTDFFAKKKEFNVTTSNGGGGSGGGSGNKGFLSRISPKTKDKSKDLIKEEPIRRMSYTDMRRFAPGNVSPPPIPPLPLHYTGAKSIEDSSDGEGEWRRNDRSSCDTLDQSGFQEGSLSSRRSSNRSARKAKQSQSKRHRMAQEIQRKLEETDVKTRELESRGVHIEKALRGEADYNTTSTSSAHYPKDETELMKEWFDLMKDITELRRYERELMVRAQEMELEDRHARLQHELIDRLNSEAQKVEKDVETENSIIQEMLDIVTKRDSLLALLDEERLRYIEEDRGLEEQMLAKGIPLKTIVNSSAK